MSYQRILGVTLLLALASCGGKGTSRPAAHSTAGGSMETSTTAAMKLEARPMLPGFRAHVDSLAASPNLMRSTASRHQAEVKQVVAAIHVDMARLGMHSDAAYEALADSVVEGSAALASASGPRLARLVAQHVDQMRRLASVYETKVAAMK